MYFTIRSIRFDDPDFTKPLVTFTDDHIVQEGLSGGEFRQSILDRFKVEVELGNYSIINNALEDFGFSINANFIEDERDKETVIADIDDVLYETDDEEFNGAVWMFHNEIIEISGE